MIHAIPTDTCYWLASHVYDEAWYNDIFKLKWRSQDKPLSIAVEDFDALQDIAMLTRKQIQFLMDYPHPFTVVTNVNRRFVRPYFLNYRFMEYGIRVWETFLNDEVKSRLRFPIFLTSANNSWEPEIYDSEALVRVFGSDVLDIIEWKIEPKQPSNVFRFVRDSLELDFLRKNY